MRLGLILSLLSVLLMCAVAAPIAQSSPILLVPCMSEGGGDVYIRDTSSFGIADICPRPRGARIAQTATVSVADLDNIFRYQQS